jgi:hypothetical protein
MVSDGVRVMVGVSVRVGISVRVSVRLRLPIATWSQAVSKGETKLANPNPNPLTYSHLIPSGI